MLETVRPLGLPRKTYGVLLAVLSAASFVAGGWINYEYASTHPGADPYLPRSTVIVPIAPAPPAEPVLPQKVKVLPPTSHDGPEQGPLVSGFTPGQPASGGLQGPSIVGAKTGAAMVNVGAAPDGRDKAEVRAQSGPNDCGNMPVNAVPPLTLDCHVSGAAEQGATGQMSIGAGSVKVVPTQ